MVAVAARSGGSNKLWRRLKALDVKPWRRRRRRRRRR